MTAKLTILFLFIDLLSFGQIPTDNLEAYYPFSGNALDESINANNGVVNGALLTTDRFGASDSAYSFDGIDDYIDLTNDFDFPERSINLWFNAQTVTTTLGSIYDSDHAAINNAHTKIFVHLQAGQPFITLGSGFTSYTPTIITGTWYMATITRSPGQTKFYLNGSLLDAQVTNPTNSGSGHDKALLGCTRLFDRYFHGKIDDVRIYSDILTDCEVYSIYLEGIEGLTITQTDTICKGDSYTFPDGSTIQSIITDTVQISSFPSLVTGCDSAFVETTLIVDTFNLNVIQNGNILTAEQTNVQYQWVKCDEGFAEIPGETNQSYTANLNGSYACVLDNGNCTDTTVCREVVNIGLEEDYNLFSIYPNPFKDQVNIESKSNINVSQIRLIDTNGGVIGANIILDSNAITLNLVNVPSGIYFIEIVTEGKVIYYRIQKV